MENVVIIGSGIAGLTAAIYTGRAELSPLVVTGNEDGGQLMYTTDVDNFPGFPDGIMGPKLITDCKKQAEKFGARFRTDSVKRFEIKDKQFILELGSGEKLESKTVIVATGASARKLGLDSEQKYLAKGVHVCATCDGFFYKGKDVLVIGGGDSAMEEAMFLTKFANKVTIVHRKDSFSASKIMQDKALKNPKIDVIWNKQVVDILGDGQKVNSIKVEDTKTKEISEMKTDGIFLAIGHIPNTDVFKGVIDIDGIGCIRTDRCMRATNVPGVFAAGDVQDCVYRQAVTAVGTGCQAAIEAERYLQSLE